MLEQLFDKMRVRRGHFALESGHHAELWLDVDRLFLRPERLRPHVAARLAPHAVDALCGPLTGGAFLAQLLAQHMGLPWVFAARVVPRDASGPFPVEYPIPAELADEVRGRRVAIVNDVINAGSAVGGALASLRVHGAHPIAIGALVVLGDAAAQLAAAASVALVTLVATPNRLWNPADCPLCAAGADLEQPEATYLNN